ncbi:MAG TPA: class IV adenylate cyclase [Bryobacteraceae bacterium]|nr:class IV adenylate cyclase [Bryobacteraceae bacterium]
MAVGALHRENEIKVAVPDLPALEARLRQLGFSVLHPRVLESNIIYDTPEGTLRARGELIRLRQAGAASIFTFKGPATVTRHKEREELEVGVDDTAKMALILQRLGYAPRFRYEKYRTEWAIPGDAGVLMVDETPVGIYMEMEGPAGWIDALALRLGYSDADYVNLSYARLYARECEKRGITPSHMLFSPDSEPQPEGA